MTLDRDVVDAAEAADAVGEKPATRRYGWATRVTAVGFIAVIAFGNFWLSHALFGTAVPDWVGMGFVGGMGVAICGGVGIVGGALWRLTLRTDARDE